MYRPHGLPSDSDNKNQQTCDDIQTKASDGGAIALFTGARFERPRADR